MSPRIAKGLPELDMPRERFELSCGARLVVSPRKDAPVTAVRVHVRGGPTLDPPGKAGLAFLTGALLDQGTRSHSEAELAALLEPAGGELSGDANGLGGSIASRSWKLLLDTVAELLTEPAFPAREVERQKGRLVSRLRVEARDPRSQGARRFRRLVYGRHWLGRPRTGSPESVATIEPRELRAHHKKHWVASRATIAVCGDVEPAKVRRQLERALAGWRTGTPFRPEPIDLPHPGVRVDAFRAERAQVHVFLGHLGIRRTDPDYEPLVVMDHVLGTGPGFTNRISRRLRDELGLAYSVHADIHGSAGILPGLFTAYIGTSPEHVETAIQGFLREIRRIRDEPVEAQELEVAKSYLLGSFALGYERAAQRAAYLVSAEVHGFPEDHLRQVPRTFAAVTPEDVQRVARAHLFPDRCCLAAAGPTSKKSLEGILAQGLGS